MRRVLAALYRPTLAQLRVTMTRPDQYDDEGTGIDWRYIPAFSRLDGSVTIIRFAGYRGQVGGAGTLTLQPLTDDENVISRAPNCEMSLSKPVYFERGMRLDAEAATVEYSNNAESGIVWHSAGTTSCTATLTRRGGGERKWPLRMHGLTSTVRQGKMESSDGLW
jgi:hypothetical protein